VKPEDIKCDDPTRRRELRSSSGTRSVSGLDSVEVLPPGQDGRPLLLVTFIGSAPRQLTPEHFVLEGGRAPEPPRVIAVRRGETRNGDDRVDLSLEGEPDHSVYTLRFVIPPGAARTRRRAAGPNVDPRYDRVSFVFDLECPRVDCLPAYGPPGDGLGRPTPDIDYLAKDYASFRRLMLDRLALLLPEWKERHEADFGVMLVEVLAYVGDQLSYQQDAVATEAYVGTARQRISLRRHGKLVDYHLHEGCNARAYVFVELHGVESLSLPWETVSFSTTGASDGAGGRREGETFLPVRTSAAEELRVHEALDQIAIYTWDEQDCCLARGATSATLELAEGLLEAGDFLLFEEVLGPRTARPTDADPEHRHVVRLTHVERVTDPLHPRRALLDVAWKAEDALPFALCLSAITMPPACERKEGISVARGNVLLVDHGRWVKRVELGQVPIEDVPDRCDGPGHVADEARIPGRFRPRIDGGPITHRAPLPGLDPCLPTAEAIAAAAALLRQDPRQALPEIAVFEVDPRRPGEPASWSPRGDLFESGPDSRHFVAELDDRGTAWLRFGDGVLGRQPVACAKLTASHRVGNGSAGNVGRGAIARMTVADRTFENITLAARNPLAARGGTAQESLEDARALVAAPLRHELLRAISSDDYEAIAEREVAGLQNASADLLWNGSWYEAHVALDPVGRDVVDDVMLCRATRVLERVRRIGHDLRVAPAEPVPLRIHLRVCARPGHLRAQVRTAIVRALGSGVLPDGSLGYFHADNVTFGEPVRLSRIVARAAAIPGVGSVRVERFERLFAGSHGELAQGFIPLGRREIARLDNDPVRPENGILDVTVEGGR